MSSSPEQARTHTNNLYIFGLPGSRGPEIGASTIELMNTRQPDAPYTYLDITPLDDEDMYHARRRHHLGRITEIVANEQSHIVVAGAEVLGGAGIMPSPDLRNAIAVSGGIAVFLDVLPAACMATFSDNKPMPLILTHAARAHGAYNTGLKLAHEVITYGGGHTTQSIAEVIANVALGVPFTYRDDPRIKGIFSRNND